jgi:ParB-like chromosome segregation protein Spo0J
MPELEVVKVPTADLLEYQNNSKLHPVEQIDQIAQSIWEFGFNNPILAWHNDEGEPEIVAGHGRLLAARKLGLRELPVVFLDHMTEEQRRAYILVDNQLTMNSGFDDDILSMELEGITDIDMEQFGLYVADVAEEVECMFGSDEKESRLATELDERKEYIVIRIDNDVDWAQAQTLFGLEKRKRWKTNKNGTGGGDERTCRVVTWDEFTRRFLGDDDA